MLFLKIEDFKYNIKETSCSMSFRSGPQNQHACD